ncbi:MAG TPA: cell division protein FtsA [Candidatus Limnocylindrales bacterium]|nr:cell division protein FtsA [Candidatus Limnocylindrales bacterium]
MAKSRALLAGLDVGTQKVALLVAEQTNTGLSILGLGTSASRGMRAGRVSDVDKTAEAILAALTEAELMAGCQIHNVVVSISGDHVRGTNSHGVVAIENGEVSARAERRVIAAAQAVPLPADHRPLHLIRREYVVDGQAGIMNPVGMSGVRLEAHLHVISAGESALRNLVKSCNKAGLSVSRVVASSLASAEAILEPEEKEMGVVVVDVGAGTTDLAIFHGGTVVHSAVFGVGGIDITRDLAQCLETSLTEAESLKKRYGCAVPDLVDEDLMVEVAGVGGRHPRAVAQRHVAEIIEPRLEEIFETSLDSVIRSGFGELLPSGLVLTGGASMLPGVVSLATRVMEMPVRLGEPSGIEGLGDEVDDPSWSTALGLVLGLPDKDMAAPWKASLPTRIVPAWVRRKFMSGRRA